MIRKFLKHVVPGVMKPMQIVWNQVIGFFFIVLAVGTVPSLIRAWRGIRRRGQGFFSPRANPCIRSDHGRLRHFFLSARA